MSILHQFAKLAAEPSGHEFTVEAFPGVTGALLGADRSGRPVLFVESDRRGYQPTLRTTHISLQLHQRFRLSPGRTEPITAPFHALRCESVEAADIRTFLLLVDAFVRECLGDSPTADSLSAFFRSLVRLFSVGHSSDVAAERQGLWGELSLMSVVRGFEFWVPFWHSEPTRRFDFSSGHHRVEVKTAVGSARVHHFSHAQLFPTNQEDILIASLLLHEDDSGLSLRDLIDQAHSTLSKPADLLKLERAIRRAVMESRDEPGPAYDLADARRSLAWYRVADAPHFQVPEPPGVSHTRYRVDLATAPAVEIEAVAAWLDQWTRTVPPAPLRS